ncbi:MAG: rpsD [Rickettsiaceae bacterium]|nr:rpsD [Rickettsiaceae bacterium]
MTKVLQSKFKVSRRLGVSVWGDAKDAIHKKNYGPGQHGATRQKEYSDHGLHLKAKQRLKNFYGRITEKQFRNTFKLASKAKGNSAELFVGLLERRLDALVYRMKIAPTIFAARQLVSHGHITVNGKRVNIPSARVKVGVDVVSVAEKSKQLPIILESVARNDRKVPDYIEFDEKDISGKLTRLPITSDVPYPFEPDLNLIVEFYSH